jgi:DNA repair ATPase RecN
MKDKMRDMEGEINSLRIEVRKMNDKMQDLLQVLSDMRRKYATQLDISDNEFLDLESVR